jgi:hypothetical protein
LRACNVSWLLSVLEWLYEEFICTHSLLCITGAALCRHSPVGIAATLSAGQPGDRIPAWVETFCTRPDQPWGPHRLLYNGCRAFFPWVNRPGRGFNHSPKYSLEVKERVELYLCSPCRPSWIVMGRILHFYYYFCNIFSVYLD